jgi:Arc/MetJ-type ribon-helix-helix transcriptional regulator
MAKALAGKQDFATRLSPETLAQLDALVRSGRFKNRTAAIEAAVERVFAAENADPVRKRRAFERACGALTLGVGDEALRAAEHDRLEWEAQHAQHSAGRP